MVVFLPLLSLREGRNPTLTMANQSTTRPSNPSTPKRVAKSASSQSLNHLLNFSLPPRQTHQVQSLPRRSRRHGTTQGVWNKEREAVFLFQPRVMITIHPPSGFVNAQCRFVMNPLGDYTVHFADPDMCVTQNLLSIVLISIRLHVVSSNGRTYYR